jgi:hypothetical protein
MALPVRKMASSSIDELYSPHKYSTLTEKDVDFFRKVLGNSGVITDSDDLANFNVDWMV